MTTTPFLGQHSTTLKRIPQGYGFSLGKKKEPQRDIQHPQCEGVNFRRPISVLPHRGTLKELTGVDHMGSFCNKERGWGTKKLVNEYWQWTGPCWQPCLIRKPHLHLHPSSEPKWKPGQLRGHSHQFCLVGVSNQEISQLERAVSDLTRLQSLASRQQHSDARHSL